MTQVLACLAAAASVLLMFVNPAKAQDSFYNGKTVRIIVGASAGGGYDTYSRTIARHIGKHIPGNPTFVVENMPGAGFLISANYMYKIAKPDGLTIGHFIGGLFLQQLLGKPGIEFDAAKFEYIGVPTQDDYVIGISKKNTGISSMDQWMSTKTIVKLGGVGVGSATDDIPKVLIATIGFLRKLSRVIRGPPTVRLAYDSGEVQGVCNAWQSFTATWPNELKSGDLAIVLQTTAKSHPELSKVPLAIELCQNRRSAKSDQLIGSQRRTGGQTLFASTRDAEGSTNDIAKGIYGRHERSRVPCRCQESQARYQPPGRGGARAERERYIQTRSETDTQSERNSEVTILARVSS